MKDSARNGKRSSVGGDDSCNDDRYIESNETIDKNNEDANDKEGGFDDEANNDKGIDEYGWIERSLFLLFFNNGSGSFCAI